MDRISQNNTYQPPWMLRREAAPAAAERPNAAQPMEQKPAPAQKNRSVPLLKLGQNIDIRA